MGERALSSYVSVHAESGKVYALQPLDHEELELLQFQVSARDAGVPPLGSNVTLQVFVLDENDNAPAFPQPEYTVFVKENNPPGCHIFTVSARDADAQENALVSYSHIYAVCKKPTSDLKTHRLKVRRWKNIFHANGKKRKLE